MDHGLYSIYLGLRSHQKALDVSANNIANNATPGFKSDYLVTRTMSPRPTGSEQNVSGTVFTLDTTQASAHSKAVSVTTQTFANYSSGELRQTQRSLDVALQGDGFLVVETPQGERYTRAGILTRDDAGQLTTRTGALIAGENGPITLPQGEVSISEDGSISVDGKPAGRLKVVQFANPATDLVKTGESMFAVTDPKTVTPTPATTTRVIQGALEGSNVDTVSELAALIQNSREFESLQKSLSTLMNDIGRKIANEIGK